MENAFEYRVGRLNDFLDIIFEALGAALATPLELNLCRFLKVVRQVLRPTADIVTKRSCQHQLAL